MSIDKHINIYIEKEKEIQSNPFLSTRIMANLENETATEKSNRHVIRILAVAASFVLIFFAGIGIGSAYEKDTANYAINVNDSQIENLNYYIFDSYE